MSRIAFLIPDLRNGGAERVALTVTGALARRGHDVDLIVMQGGGELLELVPAGVRVISLDARRTRNAFWPLVRYLRRNRPDVLQVSMWALTIVGILAARLSGVRVVVSDHSVLSQQYPKSKHFGLAATIRLFYPLADARVIVSNGAAEDISRLSGIAQQSISVIPNPIDLPSDIPERSRVPGVTRILAVGNLKAVKNHALLIRAFAKLPARLNARLVIAGEGSSEELDLLAEREGVADRVVFTGFVQDVWPLYASADLFALSSLQESFGNVLVEAMYAGLPIVSTDTVGAREVLENGRWGRLVDPHDADAFAAAIVEQLDAAHDPEALRRRAEELSGEVPIRQYIDLLLPGLHDQALEPCEG